MKQKTAYLGLFTAVAIIFGYVETLIPVFAGIPGIKLPSGQFKCSFYSGKILIKRSNLGICSADPGDRLSFWQYVQHSL